MNFQGKENIKICLFYGLMIIAERFRTPKDLAYHKAGADLY